MQGIWVETCSKYKIFFVSMADSNSRVYTGKNKFQHFIDVYTRRIGEPKQGMVSIDNFVTHGFRVHH